MPFDVIPAIDVSGGKLCRMAIGGPAVAPEFGGDPVAAAESFLAAGARWLHVVDVDLAFVGEARNLDVLRRIVALGVAVQASGGLRTVADLHGALDAGATRAVVGSGALADRSLVVGLVADLGARVVIGVETEGGRIRPRGRDREVDLDLVETVTWLAEVGAARLLYTNVPRVGEVSGPDLEGLRLVVRAGPRVLVAGGIATEEDLRSVAAEGAEAAVVGRAALEGRLDLRSAIASFA
ncbi:MAG TPA: HisA/HisF-related TIM barrel protein [Actinomycetota bacterium]|jgi:phosphoribosylformimino-5-aminoimidazole carboxamide ribotide isomerase|nr:HisA/HisF-related TIM barrel protein [Actinomycetota bacterium]